MKQTTISLLAVLFFAPVTAAPIVLDGLVPGVGRYTKPIQSIRERKFEYVIEQQTDFSCGAASLASVLKYAYNLDDITEESVLMGMLENADMAVVQEKGFSLLDMKYYVQSKGMRARGYRVDGAALKKLQVPAILLLDDGGYSHFVVFRRISQDEVYLGDPALGNRIMPLAEFEAKWNSVVFIIIGSQYDRDNPLLSPRARLTYKALDPIAPLTDAELVEFGFSYSDIL